MRCHPDAHTRACACITGRHYLCSYDCPAGPEQRATFGLAEDRSEVRFTSTTVTIDGHASTAPGATLVHERVEVPDYMPSAEGIHEGAHAVVGVMLGGHLVEATIRPHDGGGRTIVTWPAGHNLERAIAAASGDLAEAIAGYTPDPLGSAEDWHDWHKLIGSTSPRSVAATAEDLVRRTLVEIIKAASLLDQRGRLDPADLAAILA